MKEYKNILVNALVNLGDVVLTTSAIVLLRRRYPAARITMMVKPAVQQAVCDNPVVDDVIVFDYRAKGSSWKQMRDMVQRIKQRNFDLSVSLDRKLRSALLCWLARIPERIGPSKVFDDKESKVTWLYTQTIPIGHDLNKTLQRETYQEIIRKFTGSKEHAMPVMACVRPENESKAKGLLARLPKASYRIALCVKGTFPLKTWPKEYFAEAVKSLSERYDAAFFIVGAPNDREYAEEVIEQIGKLCGSSLTVANFCGDTSIVDLLALIQECQLFLTVDTGAAHVLATAGKPMVVLYGCTHPDRWHPASEAARVLTTDEACCPCACRPEECPYAPKPRCLWNLLPGRVIEECEKILPQLQNGRKARG